MELTTPEQVKAVMHPLRQQILDQLDRGPATPSEVARALGLAASKVHYHVRILEKAGVVALVETRQVGSIMVTYFAPTAHHFELRLADQPGRSRLAQSLPLLSAELKALLADLQRMAAESELPGQGAFMSIARLGACDQAQPELDEAIRRLQEQFANARERFPGRQYRVIVGLVPMDPEPAPEKER
jgi:DNA-binding transcriptional ArsR family regulator